MIVMAPPLHASFIVISLLEDNSFRAACRFVERLDLVSRDILDTKLS